MNGRLCVKLTLAAAVLLASGPLLSQQTQELESLRGANPVGELPETSDSEPMKAAREPIPREFEQQPPLIPHATGAYKTNLETNKCLSCHREGKSGKKEAPKVSESHFMSRDGEKLADVSASRYFCTQCHVEQFNAPPLVDNEFEPIAASQ
jgi:cytochrome c-type protein NapB